MRAIIEGIRYDSDTAELIGESGGGNGRSDFRWWHAGLYRGKKSFRYFLAGEGGPMTRFCTHCADGMQGYGSKIIPLSSDEAFEWAQRELQPEQVEQFFAGCIDDA